ncbi:MAG: family 16 glycosylhydrolase [Rikenellaceae bacterium]
MKSKIATILFSTALLTSCAGAATCCDEPYYNVDSDPKGYVDSDRWTLVWADEFDYPDSELENDWISDNGRYKAQIASMRWRENAKVSDGSLKLISKRDDRDPRMEWSTGNLWTKQTYQYGYFECRYKYAEAHTINNAFWLMPAPGTVIPEGGAKFEIDVNEGHYPNLLYLDLHDWTNAVMVDGKKVFPRDQRCYVYGAEPFVDIALESPIKGSKIRFSSHNKTQFNIREFRALAATKEGGYPSISSSSTVEGNLTAASRATAVAGTTDVENILDGDIETAWVAPLDGEKWFEVDLGAMQEIGAIQFVNGAISSKDNSWIGMVADYTIDIWNGSEWVEAASWDVADKTNFATTYHTYGLEWTKDELVYYFDGREIRREKNEVCHNPANVYVTTAVLRYLGEIPDNVDGSTMEVDYVRIYAEK